MRTNIQAPIGCYSSKPISRRVYTQYRRLLNLVDAGKNLRFAETKRVIGFSVNSRTACSEMPVIIRLSLQAKDFSITERILSRLVLNLGHPVNAQCIVSLVNCLLTGLIIIQ